MRLWHQVVAAALLILLWPAVAAASDKAINTNTANASTAKTSTAAITAPAVSAPAQLAKWQMLQGRFYFQQQKWIRGLKKPLQSSGYLQLETKRLLWITEKPVQQQIVLDNSGVQQQLDGALKLQPGTELIGSLMLAVMQQDIAFLQQHFVLQHMPEHCVQLQPLKKPLTDFYRHITLCGADKLQQITLLEISGNRSDIQLSTGATQ